MAITYTVFCKKSAREVSPEQLLKGILESDLHTIAEGYEVPEEVILAALGQLRMANVSPPGFDFYRLSYRDNGLRQVDVHRWEMPDNAGGVIQEALLDLEAKQSPGAKQIRNHIESTTEIAFAQFGSMPDEAMAPVLASEVMRWLAQYYEGIIQADDYWWELGHHKEYQKIKT